ncbi:MAG: sugar phosphate isomerase/epimerase family protein [Ginsengibacter sp.]
MNLFDRRNFIKSTTLAGLAFATVPFNFKKYAPLLSFSTLGCPDWSFDHILDFAVNNHYNGIEIRGIKRELDLLKCAEFSSRENTKSTKKRIETKNLKIVDLGSSAQMHHQKGPERDKSMDEVKRFIELAHQLNCPYVRVFPNIFPKGVEREEITHLIVTALQELGDYAKGSGVKVLMETHGELVLSEDIQNMMQSVNHPDVGLVWDIVNMWSVTKEPVEQVYTRLKKYIHHTHLKDLVFNNGKVEYVLLGKGTTPIFDAIDLLAKDRFKGYFSFEWEKLWHPEIAAPEVALADYPKAMKDHFMKKL